MKDNDSKLLEEAYGSITFNQLIKDPAVLDWLRNPEQDMSEEVFRKAFEYYANSGKMPYGTMKARTGDPEVWIAERLPRDVEEYQKFHTI